MTDATLVKKIGKYEVVRPLGRGGMGIVYLAEDKRIGRKVAIKTLTEGYTGQPDMLERFYREAQAGILQHPNIVTVFDLGDQDGMPFIVMDYVAGDPLDKIISSGRQLPLVDKLSIIEQVCSALHYAHSRGIIHRDIKPANIMVEPSGHAKLLDFGIAHIRNAGDLTALTRTGNVIGTIYYIAPERLTGAPFDGRSDIFSTGVMLYQLLAGQLPFTGEDIAVLQKLVNERHPPLSNYLPNYPPELDEILDRALAKDPEYRYATAEDFAVDLHGVSESLQKARVADLFNDAERLTTEQQFGRAKEVLLQLARIDSSHTGAKQLLGIVQKKLDQQGRAERVRQLLDHVEEHFFAGRFTEAITALEQASKLDPENANIKTKLEAVREKKRISEQIEQHLLQAQAAREKQDYTGALSILERARSLEPENSRVLASYAAVQKQLQETANRDRVRELLENARRELVARRFTAAIEILQEAGALDSSNAEVDLLRDRAQKGKEQEDRRRALEEIQKRVAEFLAAGNIEYAGQLVNRAIERLPNETVLHRLKTEVEAQAQELRTRQAVDATIARVRQLFATAPLEALSELQSAIAQMPGQERLEAYHRSLKEQFDALQGEQVRAQALGRAREFIQAKQWDKAIGVLESFHLEYGADADAKGLLELARQERRRARVEACIAEARALDREQRFDEAIQPLETGLKEFSDPALSRMLKEVRAHQAEFQRKRELLEKQVQLLRSRGDLEEAIQLLQNQLAATPRNARVQSLLATLQAELGQRQAIQQGLTTARQALETRDFAAGWESLQNIRRAYGESAELSQAIQQFEAQRTSIAQETLSKAIETARAALVKDDTAAAIAALQTSAPMVEFADPAQQADWRRMAQAAKEARSTGTVPRSGSDLLDAVDVPAKSRTLPVWAFAVLGLLVVVGVVVAFRSKKTSEPNLPSPPSEATVRIAKAPAGAALSVDNGTPVTVDASGAASLSVKPGTHHLAVSKDGFEPFTEDVTLSAGDTYRENVPALVPIGRSGTLSARGNLPEFKVFVDGVPRTAHADKPISLEEGTHKIRYSAFGYIDSPEKSLVITRNKETTDTFNLEKLPPPAPTVGRLMLTGSAPGAQVSIDGVVKGAANDSGTFSVDLPPGAHKIELQASSYKPLALQVSVAAGQATPLVAKMEQIEAPKPPPPPPAVAATIRSFTTDPQGPVHPGDQVTLKWETENASSVTLDPLGRVDLSGHQTVTAQLNASYVLTATGGDGKAVRQSLALNVVSIPQPPPQRQAADDRSEDDQLIHDALMRFQAAYNSRNINQLKAEWLNVGKRSKQLEEVFQTAEVVKIQESCIGQPEISGTTAAWHCNETLQFSKGDRPRTQANTLKFVKQGTKWVLEDKLP